MSIRLRLTLLYSAILALTLIVSAGLLYVAVARLTMDVLQDALVDQAKLIVQSRDFSLEKLTAPSGRFTAPKTYVQSREVDGDIIARTDNLGDAVLPLSDDQRGTVLDGHALITTVDTEDGRIMVYSTQARRRDEVVGIIQVGRSIAGHDQSLETLRQTLLVGIVGVTVLAFGFGWVLAGLALRPIARITQTAQAIGDARDFSQRVTYSGPPDELGRLTTTFNAMLTELEDAFSQVERALHAQRRFAADASHELRTPLTSIRGNVELLLREPPISAEDRGAVISDIMAESERLIRLVNDLLVLVRTDAQWTLASDAIPIRPLVDELVRQMHGVDQDRSIDSSAVEDIAVLGDRDALKQVLLILLDNALKYTPPDGSIIVSAGVALDRARISVRDTGPGIEPALLPHVFERFARGDAARGDEGVGLGLAIARALVQAQGGSIAVDSRPGQGTTFTITLPASHIDETAP